MYMYILLRYPTFSHRNIESILASKGETVHRSDTGVVEVSGEMNSEPQALPKRDKQTWKQTWIHVIDEIIDV